MTSVRNLGEVYLKLEDRKKSLYFLVNNNNKKGGKGKARVSSPRDKISTEICSNDICYCLAQKKHLDLAQADSSAEETQRAHVQLGRFYLSEHERLDGNWRGVRMLKLAKQHFHESLKLAETLNLPIEKVGYLEHK